MYTRLITTLLAIFSILCLSHITWLQPVSANQQAAAPYEVSSVTTDIKSNGLTMTLSGNAVPAYTVSERFDPYRLVVDIAEAQFDNKIDVENILPENSITKLNLSMLKDQQPTIARFEFAINDSSTYDVQRIDNDLQIKLLASTAPANQGSPEASQKVPAATAVPQDTAAATIFEAPTKDIDLLKPQDGSIESEVERLKDSFSFSGYKNERISVDFYKIDIHNVFRLFRQISDLNIIVDESVNGSITLALNDVPWDFALDIILNLADLKKEERYNTIVIYPNSKEFLWPERAMDNLSFEADTEVVQEEALIIQQSTSQPVEIMQAKELLIKAIALEKKEDFEEAAELYEKAFTLWPDNGKIASKLANLYLGRLRGNAKASFYAQQALAKDPSDTKAALYSAISAANMDKKSEALEFFAQSISDSPPMKEALISYAAFSENYNQNEAALKLLDTYTNYYGDSVHTMVSKARLLDKLGESDKAKAQYRALLASGFQMRADLKSFAESRVK